MDKANLVVEALLCHMAGCNCQKARPGKGHVHCPAHEDKNPSLSVTEEHGKVLLRCRTNCARDAVIVALQKWGLWPDPQPSVNGDRPKRRTGGQRPATRYETRRAA